MKDSSWERIFLHSSFFYLFAIRFLPFCDPSFSQPFSVLSSGLTTGGSTGRLSGFTTCGSTGWLLVLALLTGAVGMRLPPPPLLLGLAQRQIHQTNFSYLFIHLFSFSLFVLIIRNVLVIKTLVESVMPQDQFLVGSLSDEGPGSQRQVLRTRPGKSFTAARNRIFRAFFLKFWFWERRNDHLSITYDCSIEYLPTCVCVCVFVCERERERVAGYRDTLKN